MLSSIQINARPMRLFICLQCFYFLSSVILDVAAINDQEAGFALAGYLPDYRLRTYLHEQIKGNQNIGTTTKQPMTDLMLFSLQPHSRGFFGCCLQEDHYELVEEYLNSTAPSPFSTSPPIRIWITLGGGGRTEAFPEICANTRLRQRLIGSILNLSSRHPFIGGIDLDFFQPRTIQERDNYLIFLREAITQWHQEGLKVSLTLHPRQGRMIPPSVYNLLDRIHFMTYDMIEGRTNEGSASNRNYHASLPKVREALEELLQNGGGLENMAHKVLLGIPAYARHLLKPSQVKTFGEIYDGIKKESHINHSPEISQFLQGDIESTLHLWQGFEWESPSKIRAKIDLAKKLKLGGVFFWELGQDKATDEHPNGILLENAVAAASTETPDHQGTSEL